MIQIVIRICAKCGKRRPNSIFEPCPHCGYQHPLTDAGKKAQKEYLEKKKKEALRVEAAEK